MNNMNTYSRNQRYRANDVKKGIVEETCEACKIDSRNAKYKLMKDIYELGFCLTDTVLYLDTHPNDCEALDYYNDTKKKYNETVEIYEKNIGPLNFNGVSNEKYWDWVATPMPWNKEGC